MIRVFRHYVPLPLLVLGIIEFVALILAAVLAWYGRLWQADLQFDSGFNVLPEVLTYACVTYVVMLAVGLYQSQCYRSVRMTAVRLAVALGIDFVALSVIFFTFPSVTTWRSVFVVAALLTYVFILMLRWIFSRLVGWHRFRRRVIVLGAGARARRLQAMAEAPGAGFEVFRYVQMAPGEADIEGAVPRESIGSLASFMEKNNVEDVVVALQERRGALPVSDLLHVRMSGFGVYELSAFIEQQTGRVDLDSLNPSWLIFSEGFRSSRRSALIIKRLFDILASSLLLLLTAPILVVTAIAIRLTSPGPIFYRQVRVGQFGEQFEVLKFRSMRVDAEKDGKPRWAQAGDPRVTPIGRIIRSTRIDEIPQIFNVLRGDMSFVGPRPERPFFVEELATKIPFYNERHIVKPGITGWAQLNYPYGASEEDARHKLEFDLYYIKNYTIFLDLLILIQTVRVVLWQDGVR
ncbi:TIGR03013 family XrtA/PEP-CTERM system glycosyltransferase [Pedomonas sp. V897]|uniref:TIGR03013 family XrtA/PEP-CTERM system glycosyltransferase n=1 Tax=Pedomonas sp. V897 TaxID=3446482 RepID=UPI003EE023C7